MTTRKRAKAIFTKTKQARKIFRIVFSTETFKKEILKSIIIAKKRKKKRKKNYKTFKKEYHYDV